MGSGAALLRRNVLPSDTGIYKESPLAPSTAPPTSGGTDGLSPPSIPPGSPPPGPGACHQLRTYAQTVKAGCPADGVVDRPSQLGHIHADHVRHDLGRKPAAGEKSGLSGRQGHSTTEIPTPQDGKQGLAAYLSAGYGCRGLGPPRPREWSPGLRAAPGGRASVHGLRGHRDRRLLLGGVTPARRGPCRPDRRGP